MDEFDYLFEHPWRTNCQVTMTLKMAEQQGLRLESYQDFRDGLVIAGFGAGITLAFADHMRLCYPGMPLLVGDMPGGMSVEQRCIALDYIACEFPTVLLAWNGLRSGAEYPRYLRQCRDFSVRCLWVYTQGEDNEAARSEWESCGAMLITSLWQGAPLGSLTPRQIERPWELLLRETRRGLRQPAR